jgi:aerobic carbon-monoxide dehydrogenase medium subunit
MWPNNFEYTRAASVDEAIALLQQNDEAKILAGGHSLLPAMKLRLNEPTLLVDIGRISSLKSIAANGMLTIGALSTHAEIAASSQVQSYASALAAACGKVGDPAVRNFGTLGGNIAHADPASDPPTVLTALDAHIHVQGPDGIRSVSASDFFVDLFTTDLQPYELVTAIEIPNHNGMKTAYVKMSHPASRYAVVGVSVALAMNGTTCESARVAIGGATVKALRSPGAEAALTGSSLDASALNAAADAAMSDAAEYITGDVTFPETYRHAMIGVYVKRAVAQALA